MKPFKLKPPAPKEHDVQDAILDACRRHPFVAWVGRFNRGTAKFGNRFIKFNSVNGFSDIAGQLKDGRFFAIECKHPVTGRVTDDQKKFMATVESNNGIAILASSADAVWPVLEQLRKEAMR